MSRFELNKKLYQEHYSFKKFCEMFEPEFDKRNGETCERYYDDLSTKKICPIYLNIAFKEFEIDILEYISKLGGEVYAPKGKYEALRFKINDNSYVIHRRFRAQTHYRFDKNFAKIYCE